MMGYLVVQGKHLEKKRRKEEMFFLMLKTTVLLQTNANSALAIATIEAMQRVALIRSSL